MRVTSTKPKKYATVEHYAMHRATVTVRNATAREMAACAEVAKRLAEIDAIEAERRDEVEAYDRAIKRIEKKVTT